VFSEDQLLMRSTAREFAQRELAQRAEKIEKEGIDNELRSKLASAGFLGAMLPSKYGGSDLDRTSFMLVLQEISKYSPTTALFVLLQHSLVGRTLIRDLSLAESYVQDIVSGKTSWTLPLFQRNLKLDGGRIRGEIPYLPLPRADFLVSYADPKTLVVIKGGVTEVRAHHSLGFRGLGLSHVSVDSVAEKLSQVEVDPTPKVLDEASLEVAAIALGMAQASLERAMDYSKSRRAFNSLLAEFQPLAFQLLEYDAQIKALERFIYSIKDNESLEAGEAKLLSIDLAKRMSRISLQVHGGYGYFEYTGVEKFYRDSAALEAMVSDQVGEKVKLSVLLLRVEPKI